MEATLNCPVCSEKTTATIPEDSCQFFFTCPSCANTLKPLQGDCCVFCSYSEVKCPSKAAELENK